MLAVLAEARRRLATCRLRLPVFLRRLCAKTRVAQALAEAGHPAQRLVLVGTAAWARRGGAQVRNRAVASDTIVIHGARDDTVAACQRVVRGAEPLELPVIVVPGAGPVFPPPATRHSRHRDARLASLVPMRAHNRCLALSVFGLNRPRPGLSINSNFRR